MIALLDQKWSNQTMPRVSEYYALGRTQASLEFVDVDVHDDVALFIDPGAIRLLGTPLSRECTSTIQSFFTAVIEYISAGDVSSAHDLLASLGEPNETHLGLSVGRSSGRGMADVLASSLLGALSSSKAVQTGILSDLEETALFVEGVDRDIISDVVTNIIRGQLADFTLAVCKKYGIEVVDGVATLAWDRRSSAWVERRCSLPLIGGDVLLLVPRAFVRRRRNVLSADQYYRHHVIPFLQHQEFNANSNLVRLLKDGTPRPPTKKTMMGINPSVKPTNVDITDDHPELLDEYRVKAAEGFEIVDHSDLAGATGSELPDFDALLQAVLAVEPGDAGATAYHRAVERLLTAIFYPALDDPIIEQKMDAGRKRIDIDYTNIARKGFFEWLHRVHEVTCSFVPVECKNYSRKLKNPEYDQLSGRFGVQRGWIGILCYRGFSEKATVLQHCRDTAQAGRGYILALDDEDLKELVEQRKQSEDGTNFELLWSRFKALI